MSMYSSCDVMGALEPPSFPFEPKGEGRTDSGEDASGAVGTGGVATCSAPYHFPLPSPQRQARLARGHLPGSLRSTADGHLHSSL